MRRLVFLVLVVSSFVLVKVSFASESVVIIPGKGMGTFILGMSLSELRKNITQPELLKEEQNVLQQYQGLKTYNYFPLKIILRVNSAYERLEELETANPDLHTAFGSGVGSTKAQITKEYGLEYTRVGPHVIYFKQGIAFTFDQIKITAVTIFPVGSQADQYYRQGMAELQVGDPLKAEQSFRKVLDIDEKHVKAQVGIGNAYVNQDKPYLAIRAFERAIAIDPRYASAYQSLGIAYMKYGKGDEAVKAYVKAVEIARDDPEMQLELANVYMELAYWDLAVTEFKKIIERYSKNSSAFMGLGLAYELRGEKNSAAKIYRKLLALIPKEDEERRLNLEVRIKILEQ